MSFVFSLWSHLLLFFVNCAAENRLPEALIGSFHCLLTMPKPLCGSRYTVENSSRDGNTRPHDLPLDKPACRSGSSN